MSKRPPIKTTIQQAIEHWKKYVDEDDLGVDWLEADTYCWRCGCKKNLQRCHIVPHALGGEDKPENIVLLCKRCHAEGPNVTDPSVMWDWIKAYKVPGYETFWFVRGREEYEFIYRRGFIEDMYRIFKKANITDEAVVSKKISEIYGEASAKASNHFGQPDFNTATMAGIYRMLIKQLASDLNVDLDDCPELREAERRDLNMWEALCSGRNKNDGR